MERALRLLASSMLNRAHCLPQVARARIACTLVHHLLSRTLLVARPSLARTPIAFLHTNRLLAHSSLARAPFACSREHVCRSLIACRTLIGCSLARLSRTRPKSSENDEDTITRNLLSNIKEINNMQSLEGNQEEATTSIEAA